MLIRPRSTVVASVSPLPEQSVAMFKKTWEAGTGAVTLGMSRMTPGRSTTNKR